MFVYCTAHSMLLFYIEKIIINHSKNMKFMLMIYSLHGSSFKTVHFCIQIIYKVEYLLIQSIFL